MSWYLIGFVTWGLVWSSMVATGDVQASPLSVPLSVGGQNASYDGVARSVVQVLRNGVTVCSGTVVDSRTVVTARHCVKDANGNLVPFLYKYEVIYGTVTRYSSTINHTESFKRVTVSGFHNHKTLDVTVLELADKMDEEDAVPIVLSDQETLDCGTKVQLYGFGKAIECDDDQEVAKLTEPKVMQVMDTKVANGPGCECVDSVIARVYGTFYEPENHILLQVDGRTGCAGDSGGLIVNEVGEMVGVFTSGTRTEPECAPSQYNLGVKLSSVRKHIEQYCWDC